MTHTRTYARTHIHIYIFPPILLLSFPPSFTSLSLYIRLLRVSSIFLFSSFYLLSLFSFSSIIFTSSVITILITPLDLTQFTGNSNTVGGGLVLPLADLGDLSGLEEGSKSPVAMVDGTCVRTHGHVHTCTFAAGTRHIQQMMKWLCCITCLRQVMSKLFFILSWERITVLIHLSCNKEGGCVLCALCLS